MTLRRAARSTVRLAPALILSLCTSACFLYQLPGAGGNGAGQGQGAYANAMENAQKQTDDQMIDRLEKARAKVRSNPGSVDDARVLAQNVAAVFETGTAVRRLLDMDSLLKEADNALDAAATANADPKSKAEAKFSKGTMYLSAGKTELGVQGLRESMEAMPSPRACVTLIAELDKQGDPKKEIVPLCKKALPNVASDETKFALFDGCIEHAHAPSVEEGLKWAGAGAVAFYKDYKQKIAAENEARRQEEEARAARQRAEMEEARRRDEDRRRAEQASSHSGGGSASSGPSRWSISLKNSCSKTVKLFLGQKPKWGSGTYTSLSSNTISSYSGNAGDMIWIVDDGQNGLSSLTPSGNQNMQILPSCTGFGPY